MLSERLRELEAEELVVRHVTADIPVRVEYELTPRGRDLELAVSAIENGRRNGFLHRRPPENGAPRNSNLKIADCRSQRAKVLTAAIGSGTRDPWYL
jgi:hypothetical protein